MEVQQVRREFSVRYYLWAQLEAEREIANSFPSLQSFKGGTTWKMHQFMRYLDPGLQSIYARALLKHYHVAAAKTLEETLTKEEELLLIRGWSFSPLGLDREREVQVRRAAGERIRYASKRTLRDSMAADFRQAFGEQCVECKQAQTASELRFLLKFNGWDVLTSFWFGRQRTLMSYKHLIASEKRITHPLHPEISAPSKIITFVCWIGLFPIEWEYILEDEVGEVCGSVIKQCQQVFSPVTGFA